MNYANFIWILCCDIWPWIILGLNIIFDIKLAKFSINFRPNGFFNIYSCLERIEFNFTNFEKVIRTEFYIISVYTTICLFFFYIVYSLFPFITVLLSHMIFFVLFSYMIYPFKSATSNNNNFKMHFIFNSKYFFFIFLLYIIIEISRVFNSKTNIEETSDSLIGGKEKRTNPAFYCMIAFFILFINVETIFIRIFTTKYTNQTHIWTFYLFMLHEVFYNGYLIQSLFTLLFCTKLLKNFRKVSFFEIFNIFISSRVAACLSLFNAFLSVFAYLARCFHINEDKFKNLYAFLDNNKLKVFYSVVYCKPYFCASRESRKLLWKGDLKAKIMKIESKNSLLPIVFLSFFFFKKYLSFLFRFYRYFDIFTLLLNYFLLFYEAFVAYDNVREFSSYYSNELVNKK